VEQLKLAEAMGVEGVAKIVAYRRRITTITEMRMGLNFSAAHQFRGEDDQSNNPLINTNKLRKRKSSPNHASNVASKLKRQQLANQQPNLATMLNDQQSTSRTKPSLYTPNEGLWENRIYSCLVISPAGRVISEFKTVKELLESERDAIKAHRSLYVKGKILHRDISSNNIIITDPKTANGFKGMLIDLDLAKVQDSSSSGARYRTGTMQFMAIEVLRKTDHTYRHDLESFFYVLLWMCARQAWYNKFGVKENPPQESLLRKWEIGSLNYIADSKEGHMTVNSLKRLMNEFPKELDIMKPLCLDFRKILFRDTADLFFGTPAGDPDQLYTPIIAAFDETISKL
jgi:hypothetical protein